MNKRLLKKILFSKWVLLGVPLAVLLIVVPKPAAADTCIPFVTCTPASYIIGQIMFFVSYIISIIGGLIVMVITWALQVILGISVNIINSPMVRIGFPIVLSLANLGFVLGIIIIGIATIVRWQQYGVSKLLGRLIIMAVVVNFGLVFAGAILNFSDSITTYFLNAISPNGIGGLHNFATSLAGAFQPQNALPKGSTLSDSASLQKAFAIQGSDLSGVINPIAGTLFTIATFVIMIIALGATVVMLLMRYIWLGFLLVVLPFAWMLSIFPNFKAKYYDRWWDKFIQNAFFPPVMLFFFWLAIAVSGGLAAGNGAGTINQAIPAFTTNNSDSLMATISKTIGGVFGSVIQNALTAVVIGGIMIGGLMTAQAMGAGFAGAAIGAVTKMGDNLKKRAGGFARRTGQRASTAPFRSERMQKWADNQLKSGSYLGRLAGRGVKAGGRIGGKDIVDEWSDKIKGMSKEQFIESWQADPLGKSAQENAAYAQRAAKEGWINDLPENLKKKIPSAEVLNKLGGKELSSTVLNATGGIIPDIEKRKAAAEDKLKTNEEIDKEIATTGDANRKKELEAIKKQRDKAPGRTTEEKAEIAIEQSRIEAEITANSILGRNMADVFTERKSEITKLENDLKIAIASSDRQKVSELSAEIAEKQKFATTAAILQERDAIRERINREKTVLQEVPVKEREETKKELEKLEKEKSAFYATKLTPEIFTTFLEGKAGGVDFANMVRGIALNMSPNRFAKLIEDLSAGQRETFTKFAREAKITREELEKNNKGLLNYLMNSAAGFAGYNEEILGILHKKSKKEREEEET